MFNDAVALARVSPLEKPSVSWPSHEVEARRWDLSLRGKYLSESDTRTEVQLSKRAGRERQDMSELIFSSICASHIYNTFLRRSTVWHNKTYT